jgi:hypothetical protein
MQFLNFNLSANVVQFLSFISTLTEYLHPDTFGRTFLLEEKTILHVFSFFAHSRFSYSQSSRISKTQYWRSFALDSLGSHAVLRLVELQSSIDRYSSSIRAKLERRHK